MYKRKTYRPKRTIRRKRRYKKRPGKKLNRVQKKATSFQYKRYCKVIDIILAPNNGSTSFTISGVGTKNATAPSSTFSLIDVQNDGNIAADMKLY